MEPPAESEGQGSNRAGAAVSDAQAFDALVGACYPELRRIAQQLLAGERRDHTLQATALVHEAWVRLRGADGLNLNDADHCLRIVARAMRRLLIDHARERNALKNCGGTTRLPLEELDFEAVREFHGWEHLDDLELALVELERHDPQLVRIVEAKIFAEMTDAEASKALGIGVTSYKKRWTFARAWLHARLDGSRDQSGQMPQ